MAQGHESAGYDLGTGLPAAADLSTHQYKAVKFASGEINICTVATDLCIGILQNAPTAGGACTVKAAGPSKAIAGAALTTVGTRVTSDSTGRMVAWATTNTMVGITLGPASGAGVAVTIDILRQYPA